MPVEYLYQRVLLIHTHGGEFVAGFDGDRRANVFQRVFHHMFAAKMILLRGLDQNDATIDQSESTARPRLGIVNLPRQLVELLLAAL